MVGWTGGTPLRGDSLGSFGIRFKGPVGIRAMRDSCRFRKGSFTKPYLVVLQQIVRETQSRMWNVPIEVRKEFLLFRSEITVLVWFQHCCSGI